MDAMYGSEAPPTPQHHQWDDTDDSAYMGPSLALRHLNAEADATDGTADSRDNSNVSQRAKTSQHHGLSSKFSVPSLKAFKLKIPKAKFYSNEAYEEDFVDKASSAPKKETRTEQNLVDNASSIPKEQESNDPSDTESSDKSELKSIDL